MQERVGAKETEKDAIARQLDAFSKRYGLQSLRDRLRIGLNEVAILAYDRTNARVKEMVNAACPSAEEPSRVYENLVNICVGVQEAGPWGFAKELANPESLEMKAWFMLSGAETMGYEREMDLNDAEFSTDVKRIEAHLDEGARDPAAFFQKAKEHLLKRSEEAIRFDEKDTEKLVPFGEGFPSFLPMAIKGYGAGVVQDADGWVYVGAREEISNDLVQSIGLKTEVGPDDLNPSRTVTYFINDKGQKVIKKLHPGLLIVLSRSFDLASSVVRAINSDKEVVEVAEDALGHIRVVQTTEKAREKLGLEEENLSKGFLRRSEGSVDEVTSDSTGLSRPREEFYRDLLYIRGNYVYLDALRQLAAQREAAGKPVTNHEKQVLGKKIWEKMEQKVEELRHVNAILAEQLGVLPARAREVIDMAGGAGDLGLAVSNELLSAGREVDRIEIVDPQEGVADFMRTIIGYLPFRKQMEEVAVHNTGYLQDAHITPDSIVVAKHACGTLTDAIIRQWRDSESPMLIVMTCCQGKAKGEPSPYGYAQAEWDRLCQESDLTNTEVPDVPGKARDRALDRLERGNRAMRTMDMARVEYLRRHGFKAELSTTDKFPKGDVIIARRLPKNFLTRLGEVQALEKMDPNAFDAFMMRLDVLAAGGEPKGFDRGAYGEDWTADDFAEIGRRFVAKAFEETVIAPIASEKPVVPESAAGKPENAKSRYKKLVGAVFPEANGRIDLYVSSRAQLVGTKIESLRMGEVVAAIKNRITRTEGEDPKEIRAGIDAIMEQMGL